MEVEDSCSPATVLVLRIASASFWVDRNALGVDQ
jgi:hypothetical protein